MEKNPSPTRDCAAEGCDRDPIARGLCRKHYQRAWHAGELEGTRNWGRSAAPNSQYVDSTGAIRRLRALVVIGHPQNDLAARLGMSGSTVSVLTHGNQDRVSAEAHEAICSLFSALWASPVEGPKGDRSRAIAQANQWVGALAWDDIDDPSEKPNIRGTKKERSKGKKHVDDVAVERAMRGERVKLTRSERIEAVRRLYLRRWSDNLIAQTLHINPRSVLRIRQDTLKLPAVDQPEIRKAVHA